MSSIPCPLFEKGRMVGCSLVGSFLLAISAQLEIPMIPVPFTLQTSAVLYLAYRFGSQMAVSSVVLYLLEGGCGMPVFAGFSSGFPALFGPTGGYLFGFLFEAYAAHKWYSSDIKSFCQLVLNGLRCESLVFVSGWCWLSGWIGMKAAFVSGVAPFALSTLCKCCVLARCLQRNR